MDLARHSKLLSQAALSGDRWGDALAALGADLVSMSGVFWCYEQVGEHLIRFPIAMWGDSDSAEAVKFTERCGTPEPWVVGGFRRGLLNQNVVVRGEELSTRRDWETGPWADFEKEFGARRLLCLNKVDEIGRPKLGVSFFRPLSGEMFDGHAVAVLQQLAQEFAANLDIMRDYAAARASVLHLEAMLDLLDEAAFLITPQRRILWMNAAGEVSLVQGTFLSGRGGTLQLGPAYQARFSKACHRAGEGHTCVLALPGADGARLTLRMVPVSQNEQSLVAVFVRGVSATTPGASQDRGLEEAYGLTVSECEVCRLLIEGLKPAEIARQRGTAISTVRSQLSSIFQKLGVTTQAQAVAALRAFF